MDGFEMDKVSRSFIEIFVHKNKESKGNEKGH